MTAQPLSDRLVKAFMTTIKVRTLADLNEFSSDRCETMQRETDFLRGLLFGNIRCEELIEELTKAQDRFSAEDMSAAADELVRELASGTIN
ncbi:hypothetical protein ACFV9C_43780 [Kribbella sp. NPDC059898]|uniref:hypothetical protein n=1 Tax=Kribbella sp. NPDC059898 TaxID=3346995 RepID=UPI00364EA335